MSDEQKEAKQIEEVSPFKKFLTKNTLNMQDKGITDADLEQLIIFLLAHPEITVLNLKKNTIRAEGAQRLGDFLKTNQTLHTLDLSDNDIGNSGAAALVEALTYNSHLCSLMVKDNIIDIDKWQPLITALTAGNAEQHGTQLSNNTRLVPRNANPQLVDRLSAPGVEGPFSQSDFLTIQELGELRTTSKHHAVYYEKYFFQALLRKQIGPDVTSLINPGETARQAYLRHKIVLKRIDQSRAIQISELVTNLNDYPHYYAYNLINQNYCNMIGSLDMLLDLINQNPNCTKQLLQYVITEQNVFAHLVNNNEQLYKFIKLFPDYAIETMWHIFKNSHSHVCCNAKEFLEFNELFPAYRIWAMKFMYESDTFLTNVIWFLEKRYEFLSLFPDYAEQAMKRMFESDAVFTKVISSLAYLLKFQACFPDYAEKALERVLESDAAFTKVFRSIDDLRIFHRFFKKNDTRRALKRVLGSDAVFTNIVKSINDLHTFCTLYPDYAEKAMELIFKSKKAFTKLINDPVTLCIFYNTFSDKNFLHDAKRAIEFMFNIKTLDNPLLNYPKRAIDFVLDNDEVFIKVIRSAGDLENFSRNFSTTHFKRAMKRVLESNEVFIKVIGSLNELSQLCELLPNYATSAIDCVIKNKALFDHMLCTSAQLTSFLETYPNKEVFDKIMNRLFEDIANFKSVIPDFRVIERICEIGQCNHNPSNSNFYRQFSHMIIENKEIFVHLIKDVDCLIQFTKMFPDKAKAAFNQICNNKQYFMRIIPDKNALDYFNKKSKQGYDKIKEPFILEVNRAYDRCYGEEKRQVPASYVSASLVEPVNSQASRGNSFFPLSPVENKASSAANNSDSTNNMTL